MMAATQHDNDPAEVYHPDAPYFHVEHALRTAYACEARDIVKISNFLRELRGSTVRMAPATPQHDRLAQAAMALQFLERTLDERAMAIIHARYTVAANRPLVQRKLDCCEVVARMAHVEFAHVPVDFLVDVARCWSRLPPQHNDAWWAASIGCSERTLRNWRGGRRQRRLVGVYGVLDEKHDNIIAGLCGPMFDAGLTKNP